MEYWLKKHMSMREEKRLGQSYNKGTNDLISRTLVANEIKLAIDKIIMKPKKKLYSKGSGQ